MPKTTDENENILENKLKFIGLNLKRLPSFLKDFEPLNFKPTKSHDDINYKIYKYINVLDIEILLTPLDRTADLEQRYKKAEPLCNYLDTKNKKNAEKFETFMEMLDNLNTEDIEKLDEEQENLNETIPLKVKYENNYIWQIYYAPESNKYFMLVPTTELTSVALFYLIKKQIESKKNKKKFYIFVPITHMEYSGNLYTSLQITDLENYLWYFTKEWPTIFEIFDKKENSTIRVVGKAKVYDNIVSDYIMNFTQKDECIEKYKLLKALFLLSTSFQNDYSFKTAIGEDGELEFKYNSEVINYENLPEFIKSQAKERTDEIKNIIKEKAKKEALLKKLKKKIDEQNAEYLEKQKQISTFLECKKTFFGKVKYFLNGRKKKEVVSIKRKVNNEEEYEDMLEELMDRFGEPPKAVQNLLAIANLKALAHRVYVREIKQINQEVKVTMFERGKLKTEGIPAILEKYKDRMSVRTGKEFYFLISLKGRKAKEFYKALDLVLEILHEFEALLPESSQKIPCSKEQ